VSIDSPAQFGSSCGEAGVDFSFRSAFRDLSACPAQAESWRLVNLLQIAGRANRSGEYSDTEVWDFRHDESGVPFAPAFRELVSALEISPVKLS